MKISEWSFGSSGWGLLVALSFGCATTQPGQTAQVEMTTKALTAAPPELPSEVLSTDCLEWAHVQEPLADLALKAMQTYGRIDPGLYRRAADGTFTKDPQSVPLASISPEAFDAALAVVNGSATARDALARGSAAAQLVCGETACPATVYSFTISAVDTHFPDDHLFSWEVTGTDVPTADQWRAFKLTHASAPDLCPVPESLAVQTRLSGLVQTSGLFNHPAPAAREESANAAAAGPAGALTNCPCHIGGTKNKNGSPCTRCPGYYTSSTASAACDAL